MQAYETGLEMTLSHFGEGHIHILMHGIEIMVIDMCNKSYCSSNFNKSVNVNDAGRNSKSAVDSYHPC